MKTNNLYCAKCMQNFLSLLLHHCRKLKSTIFTLVGFLSGYIPYPRHFWPQFILFYGCFLIGFSLKNMKKTHPSLFIWLQLYYFNGLMFQDISRNSTSDVTLLQYHLIIALFSGCSMSQRLFFFSLWNHSLKHHRTHLSQSSDVHTYVQIFYLLILKWFLFLIFLTSLFLTKLKKNLWFLVILMSKTSMFTISDLAFQLLLFDFQIWNCCYTPK